MQRIKVELQMKKRWNSEARRSRKRYDQDPRRSRNDPPRQAGCQLLSSPVDVHPNQRRQKREREEIGNNHPASGNFSQLRQTGICVGTNDKSRWRPAAASVSGTPHAPLLQERFAQSDDRYCCARYRRLNWTAKSALNPMNKIANASEIGFMGPTTNNPKPAVTINPIAK